MKEISTSFDVGNNNMGDNDPIEINYEIRKRKNWLRYLKSWEISLGFVIVGIFILTAVFAPWLAPYDPLAVNIKDRLIAPCSDHYLGTDVLGRDVLSRIIYGGRISIIAASVVLTVVITIGGTLGAISGYFEGIIGTVIMRVTDIFLSFPGIVLAMAVNAAIGPSLVGAFIAISFVWWPGYARLIRAQVISLKSSGYVDSARAIGCKDSRIILKHILPNSLSPIIVKMTLDVGFIILTMATLSFIGLGAQPPTPEWGAMVTQGRAYLIDHWWWSTFPGLAIMITVIGFNLLGDGLREILDPRLQFGEVFR